MWASLAVVLIILGCVAYQYLKGTLVKAFATIIVTICASVIAFAYFEILADVFISRSDDSRFLSLVPWAQMLSFLLLFVLAFAIMQTLAGQLARDPIDFGLWPERIGRVVCGIFSGLILSGLLITALAMAPLSDKYPYQRFDQRIRDPENPDKKALLNVDAFVTGSFSALSTGSLSGKRSFASLHPNFINHVFLNRHEAADDVSIVTSAQAIEVPRKQAAWPAPADIRDTDGNPLRKTGHNLTIVRVGIKKGTVKKDDAVIDGGTFTLSQLRLICKRESDARDILAGKAKSIYPVGYLRTASRLQIAKLSDPIKLKQADFAESVRWIDFAFYVPNNFVPVLVEFKQNSIVQLRRNSIVSTDQAPPPAPFVPQSEPENNTTHSGPSGNASSDTRNRSKTPARRDKLSDLGKSFVGPQLDEDE